MDAEDHLFLADPFHVQEHLHPLSANNPACPYGLTSFLKEKVYMYLVGYTSPLTATVLFTPGDTPTCCRSGLLFIYKAAERRTLLHEIQMKAGHVWHRKKLASDTWQEVTRYCTFCAPENPFKVMQVLQLCGLKFMRARSDLTDSSYSESLY